MDFQVNVRKYGGRYNQERVGDVPTELDDLIQVLQETRLEIPPEHRANARVSIEPEGDYDNGIDCLSIYYYRPRTPEEIAADDARQKAHWEQQVRDAEQRLHYCQNELKKLKPNDP